MKIKVLNRAISDKNTKRFRRKLRIRGKISGTTNIPRMTFFRSNKNLSVQVINDEIGQTLVSISTYEKNFLSNKPTIETAKMMGVEMINRLKSKNITQVVFDRNGYKYHGVLHAFVKVLRAEGIKV